MALSISRTYFGGVLNFQGISSSSRVTACLSRTSPLPARRYATASVALTKKGPVTAKGTRKDAHNKPATPKKSAPKKLPKQPSSPAMETAHSVPEPIPAAEHSVKKNAQADPKQQEELTEEERLAEMERMLAFAHLMPTIDPWGQDITETLGGLSFYLQETKYSYGFHASQTSPSLSLLISHRPPKKLMTAPKQTFQILSRIPPRTFASPQTKIEKFTSYRMSTLLSMKALPGLRPNHSWRERIMTSLQVFKTQSVEPDALIAPFRQLALKSYEDLNMAVAR